MTKIFETPKVLHIQECDVDGNTRIVRYYREDTINYFLDIVKASIQKIEDMANMPEK